MKHQSLSQSLNPEKKNAIFCRIDVEKELEKIDDDGKPKGRSFVDGKEIKGIPEHIDTKGEIYEPWL